MLKICGSDLSVHIKQIHLQHQCSNQSNYSISFLTLGWVVCTVNNSRHYAIMEPKPCLSAEDKPGSSRTLGDVSFKLLDEGANQELFRGSRALFLRERCNAELHKLSMLLQWAHSAVCLQNRLALAGG